MHAIAAKNRAAVQTIWAVEMWKNNTPLRAEFLDSALEYGIVEFDFDCSPYEPETHIDPGCDAECNLTEALMLGIDVVELLTKSQISTIEENEIERQCDMAEVEC